MSIGAAESAFAAAENAYEAVQAISDSSTQVGILNDQQGAPSNTAWLSFTSLVPAEATNMVMTANEIIPNYFAPGLASQVLDMVQKIASENSTPTPLFIVTAAGASVLSYRLADTLNGFHHYHYFGGLSGSFHSVTQH